jgi:hypothetical protein
MKTLLSALPLVLLLSACSSVQDRDYEVFDLLTIDQAPLPGSLPWTEHIEVTSGTLTLFDDGRLLLETVIACKSDLPSNVSCEIEGDGTLVGEGTYSRTHGLAHFSAGDWPSPRDYAAEFDAEFVRITFVSGTSGGFSPPSTFEFRSRG